VKITLQA
jgi:hypothetical protein